MPTPKKLQAAVTNDPSHSLGRDMPARARPRVFWRQVLIVVAAVATLLFVLTYSRAIQGMVF